MHGKAAVLADSTLAHAGGPVCKLAGRPVAGFNPA
jgi:hypothetical protein